MKILGKRALQAACIFVFMIFILTYSRLAKEFAYLGIVTWFEQMIPSLVPFMILSGILIRLDLACTLAKPFEFILKPLFRVNGYGIYIIVMGFLCGFPMGADRKSVV